MVNEDKLTPFHHKASEIAHQQKLLDAKLSQRPNSPQVGDIFIFAHPEETIGVQWVILSADEKEPQHLLTVPADDAEMVGSTDIELPNSALCSPLTLRCDQGLWIHANDFNINFRVGVLEEWHRRRALDKVKQISGKKFRLRFQRIITKMMTLLHSQLPKVFYRVVGDITQIRSSVLHQEMNYDPEYVEWIGLVSKERKAVIQGLNINIDKFKRINKPKLFWKSAIRTLIPQWGQNPLNLDYWVPAGVFVLVVSVTLGLWFHLDNLSSDSERGENYAQAPVTNNTHGLPKTLMVFSHLISIPNLSVLQNTILHNRSPDLPGENVTPERYSYPKFSQLPSEPSPAVQAFHAGLWRSRQELLSLSPTMTAEKWLTKNWLETKWASYFELGRWLFLLETVCQSISELEYEVPAEFWAQQTQIVAQLTNVFSQWQETGENRQERRMATLLFRKLKKGVEQQEDIGQLLAQLSNTPHRNDYVIKLAEKLKDIKKEFIVSE